jgi:FkbH-like protein
MKILCISDLTLDPIVKAISNRVSDWKLNVVYAENLTLELSVLDVDNDIDLIYIHIDAYFKKYEAGYLKSIMDAIYNFTQKTTKNVVCSNVIFESFKPTTLLNSLGLIFDTSISFINTFNQSKTKLNNLYFFDMWSLFLEIGTNNIYNYRLGHLYQMPYNKNFIANFEERLVKYLIKLKQEDKKVIVLDCDNTLWKGVLGEDGIEGIKCDLNEEGLLFNHFQQFILQKKAEGFLLTLCSKNNENDVKEAFIKKRMPLDWNDFVVKKINWADKQLNLQEIANELNLGINSFVFIDDSDFETNSVKELLPEIHVIKFEHDYNQLLQVFNDINLTKKNITDDDLNKTEQYLQESLRTQIRDNSASFENYIESLQINIQLDVNSIKDLERISQLTEKTNQFNFNKKKYEYAELFELIQKGNLKVYSVKVSDKFGDYGLVGVILVKFENDLAVLENYIMSCRALGRRIEYDFLNLVERKLFEENGIEIKQIKFVKTEKNAPAEKFYNEIKNNYGNQ